MQSAADKSGSGSRPDSVLWRHVRAQAARRAAQGGPAGPPELPPPQPARTPERAIAGAIARAADRIHALPLFFDRIETGHAVLAEMAELLPEQALLSVVEGAVDALGVVAICPQFLTSLIEMQAIGRISARPAVTRRPTRTDGAICADFLNACLSELGVELAPHRGFHGLGGYRYASFLDDPRPLEMLLDDVPFRRIAIQLRAGAAGQRDGRMVFFLPAAPAQVAGMLPAAPAGATTGPPEGIAPPVTPPPGVLAGAVQAAPITLYGVLCRRMISLGELQALAPGAVVTLPPDVLAAATLETASGQVLFNGKLGELAGRHALRLQGARDGRAASGFADTAGAGGAAAEQAFGGADFGEADFGEAAGAQPFASDAIAALDFGAEPAPLDLAQPDPFRPDDLELSAGGFAADGAAAMDLSAWDDPEPAPLAPLSIG